MLMRTLALTGLLGIAFTLGGCEPSSPPAGGGTIGELKIAVIPKGTTHEFWKSIHAGAIKASLELSTSQSPVKII